MKDLKIKKIKIKDLKAAEYNPRQATKEQAESLHQSLKKFGVVEPVIVNENKERKNIIVGGHFRVRELKKLGYEEVACTMVNLPLDEERELNIRLNANVGEWDMDSLANNFEVEELNEWGLDIPDIGVEEDKEIDEKEKEEGNTEVIKILCRKDEKEEVRKYLEDICFMDTSFNIIIED